MDAPKCRLCQKRHYGACSAGDLPDVARSGAGDSLPHDPPGSAAEPVDVTGPEYPVDAEKPALSENDISGHSELCPFCGVTHCDEVVRDARLWAKDRERRRLNMRRRRAEARQAVVDQGIE